MSTTIFFSPTPCLPYTISRIHLVSLAFCCANTLFPQHFASCTLSHPNTLYSPSHNVPLTTFLSHIFLHTLSPSHFCLPSNPAFPSHSLNSYVFPLTLFSATLQSPSHFVFLSPCLPSQSVSLHTSSSSHFSPLTKSPSQIFSLTPGLPHILFPLTPRPSDLTSFTFFFFFI